MSVDPVPGPPVRLDYRTAAGGDAPRRRRTLRSVLVETAVVLGIVCVLVAILLPSLNSSRRVPAYRIKCASNLRQIAMACIMYAHVNGGRFPDSAGTVLAESDLTGEALTCPATNDVRAPGPTTQQFRQQINASRPPGTGGYCSYVYVGAGLTSGSPSEAVLAYEPVTNHRGAGGNVVYADAHVEWHPAATLNQIIGAVQAGQNPPTTAPVVRP